MPDFLSLSRSTSFLGLQNQRWLLAINAMPSRAAWSSAALQSTARPVENCQMLTIRAKIVSTTLELDSIAYSEHWTEDTEETQSYGSILILPLAHSSVDEWLANLGDFMRLGTLK